MSNLDYNPLIRNRTRAEGITVDSIFAVILVVYMLFSYSGKVFLFTALFLTAKVLMSE